MSRHALLDVDEGAVEFRRPFGRPREVHVGFHQIHQSVASPVRADDL